MIRFATGVDKHKPVCYHEFYQWHTYSGTSAVILYSYNKRWSRIPGSAASPIIIIFINFSTARYFRQDSMPSFVAI